MEKGIKETPKWRSVSIMNNMIEEIEKLLPKIYGFSSVSDYVHAAIRRKLDLDIATVRIEKDREKYEG